MQPFIFVPELGDFVDGNLVIDCVDMQLTSHSSNREGYSGPGSVVQADDGDLRLKLYSSEGVGFSNLPQNELDSCEVGEIIPDEAFFELEALDIYGKTWTAKNILPIAQPGTKGTVLTADVKRISVICEVDHSNPSPVWLFGFSGNFDFPRNVDARTTKTVEGKAYQSHLEDRAQFSACNLNFDLEKDEDWLLVSVHSPELDITVDSLDLRVTAALQFVLSQRLRWSFYRTWTGNTVQVHIRPFRMSTRSDLIKPPIVFQDLSKAERGAVWTLFGKYLKHVIDYEARNYYHPLTALISYVISAGSHLENRALITSTAVEGLLNLEFSEMGISEADRNRLYEYIETAVEMIESEPGFGESFKDRVCHLLKSTLPNPSAQDKLYYLANEDKLDERLIRIWKHLRHPAAHARHFGGSDYASRKYKMKLSKQCDEVNQLFNQLVFLAIGYDGPYTDYSVVGWPMRSTESVEDDITDDIGNQRG
jgi:hypothetical protein